MANLTHSSGGNYIAAFLGFLEGLKTAMGKEGMQEKVRAKAFLPACLTAVTGSLSSEYREFISPPSAISF